MENFKAYLIENGRAQRTVSGYLADLTHFGAWFQQTNQEQLSPTLLTPTDIREYRGWLQAQRRARPASVNRRLAAIRAYVKWAQDSGQITSDPARGIRLVAAQKLAPQWLDRKGQRDLHAAAERALVAAKTEPAKFLALRDWTVVELMLNTGLRIAELCALTTQDVTLSAKKGTLVVRQGKGEKRREIPLNQTAREALATWLTRRPGAGLLFAGQRNEEITPSGIHRRLAELGRIAGVEVHAHTLRHTFAKNLIDAGVTLEKVAALLGHSSLNTTRMYVTPGAHDLAESVEKLSG